MELHKGTSTSDIWSVEMTLSVAVCYPPEDLKNLERDPGTGVFERAIIIAADSLYSDRMGRPVREDGLKLVPLGNNIGAVFAGTVTCARKALDDIKLYISGLGGFSLDQFGTYARGCFDAAVPPDEVVECLIGIVCQTTETRILKLSSSDRFIPHYSQSHELIGGHEQAKTKFATLLNDKRRLRSVISRPGQMGNRVQEALDSTIQAHYPTVGGSVQYAIVTKDRFLPGEGWEVDVSNLSPAIRRITLRPDETH